VTTDNPIEEALYYAHANAVDHGPDAPDWEPHEVWFQLFRFCNEVTAIEGIIENALESGDVAMLSRATASLQHTTMRQFGGISSAVTFTAGKLIEETTEPSEAGKYENLFQALIDLGMVTGDADSGRNAARMTDTMHRWVAEANDGFMYLMASALRDMGWSEEQTAEYISESAMPDLDMGLLENLDSELMELFEDSDDEDEEK
jgi:hypothetical protein